MAPLVKDDLEKNIQRYFAGRVALALAGFASIPLLNRGIGVENYGQLSLWLTISTWLPLLFGGWLQQSVIRYHRQYQLGQEFAHYQSTTRTTQLTVSALAAMVTFLAVPYFSPATPVERSLIAVMAGLMAQNIIFAAIAQAEQRVALVVWSDLARAVSPLVLFLFCLAFAGSLSRTTALACFATGLLLANLQFTYSLRRGEARTGSCTPSILRKLAAFGLPMGIWGALALSQVLVGRFTLQLYGLRQELGVYTAIQDFLTKTATVLFMPITYALHGQVMAMWAEGQYDKAREAMRRCYLYQIVLGSAIAVTIVCGQPLLFSVLFGSAESGGHSSTGTLVLLLTASVILSNFGLVSHKGLEIGERTDIMAALLMLSLGINTIVSLSLTPSIGSVGVAYGLLAGNASYLCLTHVCSRRFLRTAGEAA